MNPFFKINDIATLPGFEFEGPCRQYASYAYLENHTALCRVLTRYKIFIDTRDRSIIPHLIMDGFWETWLTQYLASIIKPGDVCIDAGANFGYYAVLMSGLAGDKGRTIAIEPNPAVAALLRLTAVSNSPGFEVVELALSDKKGKLRLHIPKDMLGDASIILRADRLFSNKSTVKVQTQTLDMLLMERGITKVDVIKIDVEGAEPMVFEGMQDTIANNNDLKIVFEYSPFLYDDPQGFTENLFRQFSVTRIKDVEQPQTLDESAIAMLIGLKDHTDLCLQKKQ